MLGSGGRLDHAQRPVAFGIDPDGTDETAMPAIHVAGWEGRADAVAWLLTFGSDPTRRNGYGGDLMGTILHGADHCPRRAARDHAACARQALGAGAPLHAADVALCGRPALRAMLEDRARAHPDRTIPA